MRNAIAGLSGARAQYKVLFHLERTKNEGIPITAITGIGFMASQKETAVIAVIWHTPNVPGHVDNFSGSTAAFPIVEDAKAPPHFGNFLETAVPICYNPLRRRTRKPS